MAGQILYFEPSLSYRCGNATNFSNELRLFEKWVRTDQVKKGLILFYLILAQSTRVVMLAIWIGRREFINCLTLCDPMDCSLQDPLSREFSRQEYWSRFPFPSPGNLSDPWVKPGSPILQADSLPSEPPGKPKVK